MGNFKSEENVSQIRTHSVTAYMTHHQKLKSIVITILVMYEKRNNLDDDAPSENPTVVDKTKKRIFFFSYDCTPNLSYPY